MVTVPGRAAMAARLAGPALLLASSVALAALLELLGLPAGLLLGPMIAAMAFALRGRELALPSVLADAALALIGLMVAPSLNMGVLAAAAREPWMFPSAIAGTLLASVAVGWSLARLRVLPGSVAIWGSMPGAATAMVMIARDAGADWRMVAAMAYLRTIAIAAIASSVAAWLAGGAVPPPPGGDWFPRLDPLHLAGALAVAAAGTVVARRLRLPAAALLGPMFLAAALAASGVALPALPGWLLALAYLVTGWRIGLGFTPDMIATLRRTGAGLLVATTAQVALCAAGSLVLARVSGRGALTAYLAMSPGGADSIAIIAAAAHVDVPFVMAMQVLRFLVVLAVGPRLAAALTAR